MTRHQILRTVLPGIFAFCVIGLATNGLVSAQRVKKQKSGRVCGDPTVACKTTSVFDANDLAFQIPANANIWESQNFYAIILKSVSSPDDNCETFVSEADRLEAQNLFPKNKVFTSRCTMGGSIYYTNVAPNQQFMAVYGGATKAQADKTLAVVKSTGKFPGANLRKMHVAFNGT
jgi:hypothetical protein